MLIRTMTYQAEQIGEDYHYERGAELLFSQKHTVLSFLLDLIGFLLSIGLVYIGYSYGKQQATLQLGKTVVQTEPAVVSEAPLSTPVPSVIDTAPNTVQQSPSILYERNSQSACQTGQYLVTNATVALCIPNRFDPINTGLPSQSVYVAGNEELLFETQSQVKYPLHICTNSQQMKIGSLSGTYYLFKRESSGGCGSIAGLGLLLTEGNSTALPVLVRYRLLDGTEIVDLQVFDDIINSLRGL